MNRYQRPSPIPRFLGEGADASALTLLGLAAAECTPGRIEAALEIQLERVAAHPEADTPEADEVRLALHSAAAQLRDPEVRRLLVERHARSEVDAAIDAGRLPPSAGLAGDAPALSALRPAYGAPPPTDAWTPPAVPAPAEADPNGRVGRLLLVGGVAAGVLVVLGVVGLILLGPGSGPTRAPPAPNVPAQAGGGAAGTTVVAGGAEDSPAGVTPPPAGTTPTAAAAESAANPPPSPPPAATRSAFVEAAAVIRDLRAATSRAKADPAEGVRLFAHAVIPLADWWARYEVGQRRAADDAVVEFLYAVASDAEAGPAAVETLARRARPPAPPARSLGPDAVWPGAWSAGLLTRLTVERELPRSVSAPVLAALNEALGAGRAAGSATFEAGAAAALRRMPALIVAGESAPAAEAFRRWADAVAAVARGEADAERLYVDALEEVILRGPEPENDRAAYDAIELLATRIRWRKGGPGRERLLAWFADDAVTPGDLRVLTGVLASKSSAEGVDPTMVLSISATADDRVQLRARYAQAWGLVSSTERTEAVSTLRNEIQRLAQDPSRDDVAQSSAVVAAVRASEAGRLVWLGDASGALKTLRDTQGLLNSIADAVQTPAPIPSAPSPASAAPAAPAAPARAPNRGVGGAPPGPSTPDQTPPSGWAEAYLRAERSIPVRLQRLQDLDAMQPPLAPVDAAVLVEAAYLASPAQVRAAAQKALTRFADDPGVVRACLDGLPGAPKIRSVAQTVETVARAPLPRLGDPDWELAARRALLDRLIMLLGSGGPDAGIDRAAAIIADSYARMSGAGSGAGVPRDEGPAQRAVRCAGALYRLWRTEADRLPAAEGAPLTLEAVDRRRASRSRIATGPLQEFAAEQLAVCELLSCIVAAERPARAGEVAGVLTDLSAQRRAADHVFLQMLAAERAIARLWSIRVGEAAR